MNINASNVIPAQAGIQFCNAVTLGPRLRGDDELGVLDNPQGGACFGAISGNPVISQSLFYPVVSG